MTLTQLNYVLALARHRHFGMAAEASFVTQPTLSMQIQKLEEELGVEIFDRSQQPIQPTEIGRLIVDQARVAVAEAQKVSDLALSTQEKVEGQLRLGVIPTLAPSLLPLFIRDFIEKYPKLNVAIEELQTQQVIERLKSGELDLGIVVTPLSDSQLKEHPIFQEPFLVYLSPDHALAKEKKVDPKHLSSQDVWLLSEGHCFREQAISLCADRKKVSTLAGNLRFESGNLETLRKMVDQSGGYTLLPLLVAKDIQDPEQRKRLRHFENPVPSREVSIVHHRLYPRHAIKSALIEDIRSHLPNDVTKLKPGQFKRVGFR